MKKQKTIKNILLMLLLVCWASKGHADISHKACRDYLSERITLEINKYPVIDLAGDECIPLALKYPSKIGIYVFYLPKLVGEFENGYVFETTMNPMLQNDKKTLLDEFCLSEKALKETKIVLSYIHNIHEPATSNGDTDCLDDPPDRRVGRNIVIDKLDELLAKSKKD